MQVRCRRKREPRAARTVKRGD